MEWYSAAEKFNQALASSEPTPGGGAAAAMTAAMGCALALMAARTTFNNKTTPSDSKTVLDTSIRKLAALKVQLNHYIQEDGDAYTAYLVAKKLPKENPSREHEVQQALLYAARVPADTAATAITCLHEIDLVQGHIAPIIQSDILCAKHLLKCALRCCKENILANLVFIKDESQIQKLNKIIESIEKSWKRKILYRPQCGKT